ncbi:MAG: ion transporter [Bacteroidales bacterium]|nr:ion transporter [Bacteroidales bacterium]
MITNLFLNDRFILTVIFFNCIVLFLEEMGLQHPFIWTADVVCLVLFTIEMVVKHRAYGVRGYWSNGWNRMDGILVLVGLISIPGTMGLLPTSQLGVLVVFRALRVFRFFKVVHLFPNFSVIMRNFSKALCDSSSLFAGYMVVLFLSAMVSCELFGQRAPEYFADPLVSIASTFRLFTIEGWYEIPDALCEGLERPYSTLIYLYFISMLVLGGIIFMSLLNSVFVDAMVSDNNDEVLRKLEQIEKKLDDLERQQRNVQ